MFNIIETPRNYILHANYCTTVMWHFTAKSHWRPYWEVSCSGKYSAGPVLPLWSLHPLYVCSVFDRYSVVSMCVYRSNIGVPSVPQRTEDVTQDSACHTAGTCAHHLGCRPESGLWQSQSGGDTSRQSIHAAQLDWTCHYCSLWHSGYYGTPSAFLCHLIQVGSNRVDTQ